MAWFLEMYKKMGYGRTMSPQKDESEKHGDLRLLAPGKLCFTLRKEFHGKACKNQPVIPPLNIDIITWRWLNQTALVFQAELHLRVQSWMPVSDQVVNPVMRKQLSCDSYLPNICIILSSYQCIQHPGLVR